MSAPRHLVLALDDGPEDPTTESPRLCRDQEDVLLLLLTVEDPMLACLAASHRGIIVGET